MINLRDYIPVKKNKAFKVLKALKECTKINDHLGNFRIVDSKNERGDYGYNTEYYYKNQLFFITSIDGARIDVRYYLSPNTDIILAIMKQDAKNK
jgi:hypothetical protein